MAREDQSKIVDFPEREVVIGEHETPVEVVTPKTKVHANMPTVEDVEDIAKKYGGSGDTYTKEEIDHIVETMRKGLYQEVDTTEYPTLEDFLDSDGEEGIIYLYPVGNEGNNYYQYIWETTREWISLGTTVVDLSQYAKLTLLAPIYDSTATYSVGAKCVYNGKLYTCSTAITQAEDFNSSHWTEISVSSGFVDLDSAQTITGIKTFIQAIIFKSTNNRVATIGDNTDMSGLVIRNEDGAISFRPSNNTVLPFTNNAMSLGNAGRKWKDLYLSGKIKDGTNEVSVANIFNGLYGAYATNSTTQLEHETINEISISVDTTFTLATAPANTYPEYKANITNSDNANAITITLPSGTIVKAESGITVSSNTFTIPADTTVVVSIQDDLALVMIKG